MSTMLSFDQVTVLILAGGRGQRMQGVDKGLMIWRNMPMIEHVIQHLNLPDSKIIISANRNINAYKKYAHNVIRDNTINGQESFQGPLAGIYSAMNASTTPYLLCVPCDSPMPPDNLLENLANGLIKQQKRAALCHDGVRLQPLFSLLACETKQTLQNFLCSGNRRVHDFFSLLDPAVCDFSSQKDRFNNFNRPDDLIDE